MKGGAGEGGGTNPYLNARREWNERYGSYIKQAHAWRLVAVLSLVVAASAVWGVVHIGSQNRFVPYVVEVDKLGAAVPVGRADQARRPDERVIRSQIARWLSSARSVVADVAAERRQLEEAYATTDSRGAAFQLLNETFSKQSPFQRAQTETVAVEVQSVLPLSDATWRVEWTEKVVGRDGRLISAEPWQATITVAVNAPTDEATILRNPMGVYVTNVAWSKRL
jgi:type IV secretion system protein VirB5